MKGREYMIPREISDQLNDRQLEFFIWIFNQCVSNFKVTKSNQEISTETEIPVSTIEKYLKKFDDLNLIERGHTKSKNPIFHNWETTSREIQLNSDVFDPYTIAKLRKSRIKETLDMLNTPKSTMQMIHNARQSRS
jgi:hypothetical protein